jgi:prolyl oligopeptidase
MRTLLLAALGGLALASQAQSLPTFPANNVPAEFFGVKVDDPYRGLEDVKDPKVQAWMKAHSDHARTTLDSLAGYAGLKKRVIELDNAVEARVGQVQRMANGDLFFTRRGAKDNTFKLYVKPASGAERLLVDPDDWQKKTGKPHAINYFVPSRDAKLVAYGISAAGSEAASIHVMDAATGKELGQPIDRAQYPGISWRPDNRSFFFLREQKLAPGMPATERYQNSKNWLHTVGADPEKATVVLGPGVDPRVEVPRTDFAYVVVTPGSKWAVAAIYAGVQREITLYSAPLDAVGKAGTPWTPIATPADKVTDYAVRGDDIYLMTHAASPRFSIVKTSLAKPDLKSASVVVAPTEEVIFGVATARDGLYWESRDGPVKRVKRMPWDGKGEVVKLPLEGSAGILHASPESDGAVVSLAGWMRARQIYAIDAKGAATNTGLQKLGPYDAPEGYVTTEVRVKSHDGAMVPLSIIHKKGLKLDGSNPTLLYGYGAYGITEEPGFNPMRLALLEKGTVFAVANVRGSGVFGQEWYKAGYKTTKPNTWKDFIACAEYLIAQKYTSNTRLGILGGSAGGILVGRAMTERPDLFAAVVPAVGVMDSVRAETTANGVPNIPEFGTVKKEDEFRALLAMSSYHSVKDGTKYPAVLLTHGVNDPRVDVWHSTKMAARLMAANPSGKPVLLNLDYEGGHGIGDTKAQRQKQNADIYSFILWQAGHPEFQPKK